MVHDDVNRSGGTFEIVSPTLECFKDGWKFFITNIVIQLHGVEGLGVKSNQMNLVVRWSDRGDDGTEV